MTKALLSTLILLVGLHSMTDAQDIDASQKRIFKLYLNGSYYNRTEHADLKNEEMQFQLNGLSIALEIKRNKFISHEFEILPIFIKVTDSKTYLFNEDLETLTAGSKNTNLGSAFRHQMNHSFLTNKKIDPYIGLSSQLFMDFNKSIPATSNVFERSELDIGVIFSVVPGININLNKRLAVNLNVPMGLWEIKYNKTNLENPAIPPNEQTNSKLVTEFIPKQLRFRLGISYHI